MGKAYGFFQYDASLNDIEAILPVIRERAETPSLVEFFFTLAEDAMLPATDMMDLLREGQRHGRNVAVETFFIGKRHEEAADELSLVLQGLYHSHLYRSGEPFFGDILFMKDGNWEYLD